MEAILFGAKCWWDIIGVKIVAFQIILWYEITIQPYTAFWHSYHVPMHFGIRGRNILVLN